MAPAPGFWAFTGVRRDPSKAATLLSDAPFTTTGEALVVKLYICPVCSLVHAYADDKEDTP